ncbi:uncharacterized protein LOC111269720 [Varroa jacobsoni]|uniref:uncharacterized protein LOC111269720 n=1 Tax=Varroa jacobsoni TaxID=62625 RepID=UPI000BF2CAAE|nr:uncharacterized protein LOC111269720 [Varroa jacobsoni]
MVDDSSKWSSGELLQESASSSLNIGAGHTGSVEIAIEEDGHEQDYADVQKFFLHSTSPASLTFSKESTTKRPAIIQLSSDNRLVQVIGPKDQLWTTSINNMSLLAIVGNISRRYPEIPKYVTIVTTTSRPFKPLRQHATRRMDSYSDGQSMESTLVYESEHSAVNESTHSTQEEPRSFTRKPKNQQQNNSHDGDDRQHAGTASVSEHELEMIESGVHQIKALPPSKRKSQQESDHKKSQKRPFASGVSQDNNIDDERKYHDLPEQEVAEEEADTSTDDTPSTTKPLDKEFPLCPGNCVMPLFSLFCDPEFKSHACDVPGRVCCVGASMKPNGAKQNGPASETTSNSAQTVAEETPDTNDGHDRECPGRCVTAFFQYTCRHPFKITDDICPIGSLCCSEKSPPSQANTEDNHQDGSANEASKKSGEQHGVQNDMQEYQHDAAESTKNKLNLIHSFLTTVLSTKRPKRRPSGIENVSADTFHSSSRPLNNFIDEVLQADETRMRPNYAVPYEPKFFPMNDVQTEGSSTSEDGSDPPEVVIEPAIPTRPTLDTSFSQLDRPPSKLVLSEFTPLKNAPFHEHHRAPHIKEDTSKRKETDSPPLRYRGYPKGPESAHPRPPSVRQDHSHHRGIVSTVARPDDGSQENARIRPPHMDLRRYQPGLPPYRRFRPLPPPSPLPSPFLSLNSSSTSNSHLFEDDLLSSSHEENNHVHEAELSLEETEHKELPQLTASTTAEVTAEGNLTNPFVSVWTPTNINSARVKEVNAMSSTLPEEQTIKVIGNGVHPSSCGLNGFHIKRGSDRHSFRTAKLGEWCWQAAIVDSEDRLLCSGAVIGAQWILTSASCLVRANFTTPVSPQTSGLRAKIGYVDLKGSAGGFTHGPIGSQTKTVSMVYSHHNFNAERRDNDVALLKLHDFIDLNGVVCIICLPSTIRPERAVENCTVTAYRYESRRQSSNGVAFENSSNVSADKVRLTYERVSKLDPQVCTDLAALRNHSQLFTFALNGSSVSSVSRSKFCAGDVDKGERIATCKPKPNLDSETVDVHIYQTEQTEQGIDVVGLGNPLVCRIDDEFYQLSGLSSMFLGCSSPASPTVFTNLAYFTGWINQITNVNRYS